MFTGELHVKQNQSLHVFLKTEILYVIYSSSAACMWYGITYMFFGYTLQLMDTLKTGAHGVRVVRHVIME